MRWTTGFFSRRTLLADRFLYASPESLGIVAERVEFPSSNGVTLCAWLFPGERPGVAIFCSGNSANVSCHLEYVRMLVDTGCSVLAFDYRGFGASDGRPDLSAISDDVDAACRFVAARFGPDEPLGLFGISLGACAAIAAAARSASGELARATGGARVLGVVAEGISDLERMIYDLSLTGSFGPYWVRRVRSPGGEWTDRERLRFPVRKMGPALAWLKSKLAATFYPFAASGVLRFAERLRDVPVLLVHGIDDGLLPAEAAIEFRRRAGAACRLWLIPHAGHAQEPVLSHRTEYVLQMKRFFAAAFAESKLDEPQIDVDLVAESVTRLRVAASTAARATLLTAVAGERLTQEIIEGDGECTVPFGRDAEIFALAVETLGADGRSTPHRAYDEGGYRAAFRQLVLAMNRMDFPALDRGLGAFLELERRYPEDFLAAVYCLRAAVASREGMVGWPSVPSEIGDRAIERFLHLWAAHPELTGEEDPRSPAAWARRALEAER